MQNALICDLDSILQWQTFRYNFFVFHSIAINIFVSSSLMKHRLINMNQNGAKIWICGSLSFYIEALLKKIGPFYLAHNLGIKLQKIGRNRNIATEMPST